MLGFDDHFYVLGFPCNQFGGQEPGDEGTIDVSKIQIFPFKYLIAKYVITYLFF